MDIKFLDLKYQYQTIKNEIDTEIGKVFDSGQFSGGQFVKNFEDRFAVYCGTKYAAGVSSGTSALWMALKAIGVEENDEVITVANSFIATAEAISMCGAIPVLVDVKDDTCTIDVKQIKRKITEKTKAIIPVHIYGQISDMKELMHVARQYGLKVVEDAAQAHGATVEGKKAGSFGDAGCFSFYPGKNLGGYGEAGCVVTNDEKIFNRICMIRDHGQKKKYHHTCIGSNERMDGLQGAVLSVKLKYLDDWNKKRKSVAHKYNEILSGIEKIKIPVEKTEEGHVYHIYQIEVENRKKIIELFEKNNIGYGIHYPCPIHLQKAYQFLNLSEGSFPVAEEKALKTISLPVYPEMRMEEVEFVANTIRSKGF